MDTGKVLNHLETTTLEDSTWLEYVIKVIDSVSKKSLPDQQTHSQSRLLFFASEAASQAWIESDERGLQATMRYAFVFFV